MDVFFDNGWAVMLSDNGVPKTLTLDLDKLQVMAAQQNISVTVSLDGKNILEPKVEYHDEGNATNHAIGGCPECADWKK